MLRIVLTGGGTGGHIYPLIAVAEKLQAMAPGNVELVYLGPKSPFVAEFEKRDIPVRAIAASKLRRYGILKNIIDVPRFFVSIIQALAGMYFLMPDAVFSKGGPGALAVVLAARFYFIPVVIHESDAVPGLTNRISSRLARRIGIAFRGAANFFPPRKTAFTGNPVREELLRAAVPHGDAKDRLGFNQREPVLLVLGGSQGAAPLNAFVADNLLTLLGKFQICHQTGEKNFEEARRAAEPVFRNASEAFRARYRVAENFDGHALAGALSAADLVLSRAGAGAIYDIAAFGKASFLVPLESAAHDHQRANAYEYAESGAADVIEQKNLTVHVFLDMAERLLGNPEDRSAMERAAKLFWKPLAAETIAKELLSIAAKTA
ncbi:MAG: UDP-N-acetylglucosamine--N-acetylmuramyl-(pentapeptide) pyrophosphoryl-undecaprenol N-acetylglucosamine transferase [Candidatus Jorgensenbacteria bacterium]